MHLILDMMPSYLSKLSLPDSNSTPSSAEELQKPTKLVLQTFHDTFWRTYKICKLLNISDVHAPLF